jgi:hypothetical protein
MSKQEHNHGSDDAGKSDQRVRSGEGVGSIVRELNNRQGQQQQQPQNRPSDNAAGSVQSNRSG